MPHTRKCTQYSQAATKNNPQGTKYERPTFWAAVYKPVYNNGVYPQITSPLCLSPCAKKYEAGRKQALVV